MKKSILSMHLEILDRKRQKLLTALLPYLKDYILGGGTALALQLNHRKSFDFDFFSSSPLPRNLLENIAKTVSIYNVSVDTADELTFFTTGGIKVSFIYYPFSSAFPNITLQNGLKMFGIKDIAIKKAYAIGRRGEYRDYFDLYIILKNGLIDLAELISLTKKIYGSIFEEKIFLTQLVYFKDLTNFEIISISGKELPRPEEVRVFFENLTKKYIGAG